jgi:hypothetical protein
LFFSENNRFLPLAFAPLFHPIALGQAAAAIDTAAARP